MLSRRLVAVAIAAALWACSAQTGATTQRGNDAVCAAYRSQSSRIEVVASGKITRVLGVRSGRSGDHEGYLVRLDSACNLTVRIETNVTLTGAVPLHADESVAVKGEYEYYSRGGVIHWTHRDPRGNHEGGYVRASGVTYQ
ncbi:MAG: DUF3465 domain-containing protein [Candidatus Eremiobacteraeota bacterium]|nr:DUF3465 domain-containing protein [Candidatus Eremiobacteraeota bacterium]